MGITLIVLLAVVGIAVLGFVGHKAAEHSFDRAFWAGLNMATCTVALVVMLVSNFAVAKTGLDRLLGKREAYDAVQGDRLDRIGLLIFGHAKNAVTPLLAFVITVASIMAAGKLYRTVRRLFELWRTGGHPSEYVANLLWLPVCVGTLGLDAYILTVRLATMLDPDRMTNGLGRLPAMSHMLAGGSAAQEILRVFAFGYPAVIVVVEAKFSSAWANFMEQFRGIPARPAVRPADAAPANIAPAPVAPLAPAPPVAAEPPIPPIAPEGRIHPDARTAAIPPAPLHLDEEPESFVAAVPPAR